MSASLLRTTFALAVVVTAAACAGEKPLVHAPARPGGAVGKLIAATREEAQGDPSRAKQMQLDVLESLPAPDDPWHLVVLQASLDALVGRSVSGLSDVSEDAALVYRTKDAALWRSGEGKEPVAERLPRLYEKLEGPFAKARIAEALQELAEHRGDWESAERWRARSGCVREATVVGPLAWASVTGVKENDPLEAFDALLAAQYEPVGPFARPPVPIAVRGRGCGIDLSAPGNDRGVRDVVVDLKVPSAGYIGVALRASGAATLRVGGKLVIERPYELGDAGVLRMAKVKVERGTVRVVARVGTTQDNESIEIGAWDSAGAPLATHAPRAGERGSAKATEAQAMVYPKATTADEKVALALGALGAGDGRTAERVLSADARAPKSAPEVLLVYGRAVETALDLPPIHRAERARAAYERVLEAWPGAWEAVLAHAVLAGVRRGEGEARMETLRDLDAHRAKLNASGAAIADAFDAAQSARDALFDRAREALARASRPLEGTSLLHEARRIAVERGPVDRVRFDCSDTAPNDRRSLACYNAAHAVGDSPKAALELERLRRVLGGSDLYLGLSLHDALIAGDRGAAVAAYRAMLPGERTLTALASTKALEGSFRTGSWPIPTLALDRTLVRELLAAAPEARDAPYGVAALLLAAGEDPFAPFAGVAERVTAADRAQPIMANAATVILAHDERYDVDAGGLVHYRMLDVRRVSGTTDVESNAQATAAAIQGKIAGRILRRRIFKKDGRILEPDRTPNAAQSHADLAQLEQGDAVEAIYEGWALPGETGDIGIDTPDLLPDRTAVANASIEIRLPKALKVALWSHPLLGKPKESAEGKKNPGDEKAPKDTKVLRWTMKDRSVRRLEDGTPKMDRSVGISLSTTSWGEVARALRETLASFDEHDPEVAAWAREASKGKPPSRALVEAVVSAAGTTVREASQGVLSDLGIGGTQGAQSNTARTILTEHEGSRTWLIVRALRELGVTARVAIAEEEPYSTDPNFPPEFGRFTHPLAVARVPDGKGGFESIWIDADVPGPPLPAGRISPELRGRMLLDEDGKIAPIAAEVTSGDGERDEVDLRLALDDKGNAKGTFQATLRGRAAQDLAEALVRVVGVERQRALRNVVLAWVPFANVEEVALASTEGSWQVALRADITVGGYAQLEGSRPRTWVLPGIAPIHVVFPRAFVTTLGSAYASVGAREDALAINRAIQYHAHVRIELPKGAKVVSKPAPFALKTGPLDAQRRVEVADQVLDDDFVLSIATSTISKSQYAAFVNNAHRTDDAFLTSTRIAP
ncbi:hypothetical protein [Pendulispora albinea]|uniref:Uncharacterized protein n=1 Tax=Pendulispora albinea TaxID=2741071 RepID=A0ABZ2M253_9BACT